MLDIDSVKVIGASAGTGKTTRLANEFVKKVMEDPSTAKIAPSEILVSTFTKKAASELISRIRQRLIEDGHTAEASELLGGYIGTVNSICGKLLRDYALEAGLSPLQNVIPEDAEQVIFSIATDEIIDLYGDQIDEIAYRLGFDEPPRQSKYMSSKHWTELVKQICADARSNQLKADQFPQFAHKSWESLQSHLKKPKEGSSSDEMNAKLLRELDRSVTSLDRATDSTKKTQSALALLKEIRVKALRTGLTWADWAVLSRIEVSQASSIMILGLVNTANTHPAHPGLHADIQRFIELIFDCAAESLTAYQTYKASAGLIDFTDQESLALNLLQQESVRDSLGSRLSVSLIDEFQDTSPIQLALFLRLAEICKTSVWVGDTKQAIYGFRGTDPVLMQKVSKQFSHNTEQLGYSYRSQKSLVQFSNALFTPVFSALGFDVNSIAIEPSRKDQAATGQSSLRLWNCDGTNLTGCFNSLASAVRQLLTESAVEILDKETGDIRPIRGADIAILCRSNNRCEGVAQALFASGLNVAKATDGLLDTPECAYVLATLKYLIDSTDRLALAQMIHFERDYAQQTQSSWLTDWLENIEQPETLLRHKIDWNEHREELPNCTAVEALQHAITIGHAMEIAAAWGNFEQRTSNIDALRGIAIEYESACTLDQSAASPAGFISYISQMKQAMQPLNTSDDAVNVLTYHGAKGLEWPVVILADLDKSAKTEVHKDVCGVFVESPSEVDLNNPLDERWVRLWPWPYGQQERNVHLDTVLLSSPEFKFAASRVKAENARLFYVGTTRARDLLVLAPYTGRRGSGNGLEWLTELRDKDDRPVVRMPDGDGDHKIQIKDSEHQLNICTFSIGAVSAPPTTSNPVFLPARADEKLYPPFSIRPSETISVPDIDLASIKISDIGDRITLVGTPDMETIGDCVHRFLAADRPNTSLGNRLAKAGQLRSTWNANAIKASDMLEMSDRLRSFLSKNFPDNRLYFECPIIGRLEQSRVRGFIDLLVEIPSGFLIFDHKTFPGGSESWITKASSYSGQLKNYADVLRQSIQKPVIGAYIHMPIVGKIIDLSSILTD